ncbi:hypothetical protein CMO95_00370 [Candidatus Woesearchaeota archaeon]|nr:hypothetical protein [Candidatus Woesearchaeota archaeon]
MAIADHYKKLKEDSDRLYKDVKSSYITTQKNLDTFSDLSTKIETNIIERLAKNNEYSKIFNVQVESLRIIHSDINDYLKSARVIATDSITYGQRLDELAKLSDPDQIRIQLGKLDDKSRDIFNDLDVAEADLKKLEKDIKSWEEIFNKYRPDDANQRRLNKIFSEDADQMISLCGSLHTDLKSQADKHKILVNHFTTKSGFSP